MKLRDYKTLLANDQRSAMLFDLTERFPRGPTTRLRADAYKTEDGRVLTEGWGSSEVPYLLVGVDSAEGSTKTGGWNPYDIYELDDDEWRCAQLLRSVEVPVEMAMAKHDTWGCDEGNAKLFKSGAQLTRRSRRMARRIRMAKKWVQENIGTAVYRVNLDGWGSDRNTVFVHADDEAGAMKQFELFMKGAFNEHCEDYREERVKVHYERPAKTPLELMALNAPFQESYRDQIKQKKERVAKLLKQIEAMDTAEQIVNIYAVNMVATWGTGEGETADA
jgi:hypothetical protein